MVVKNNKINSWYIKNKEFRGYDELCRLGDMWLQKQKILMLVDEYIAYRVQLKIKIVQVCKEGIFFSGLHKKLQTMENIRIFNQQKQHMKQ